MDVAGSDSNSTFTATPKGYVVARKKAEWLKSQVFGKSFRLTRQEDEFGNPEYTLEVRVAVCCQNKIPLRSGECSAHVPV